MNNFLFAFGLTLFAGLCTGIGSSIALLAKKTNTKFLAVSLGFSAGVMIYVSMIDIFVKAKASLTENPHEMYRVEDKENRNKRSNAKLLRMGLFTAMAVAVHNFPEGIATFISALQAPSIAIPIAVAISIHNIPEGIAISVPVYYATGDKRKAFIYSFLSGLSEPAGALLGYLILMPFLSNTAFGIVFAAVAGIMVFISLDELLPSAREYGEHHLSIYGLVAGMAVMAVSLLLFVN